MFDGDNRIIDATPKALEILRVLIEADGRVVSKEEIISRVWANSYVEEANLSHHIFRLRKALGESEELKFIETVSKRGYRFVAEVRKAKVLGRSEPQITDFKLQNSPSAFHNLKIPAVVISILLLILAGAAFAWFSLPKSETVAQIQNPKPEVQKPMSIDRVTNGGSFSAGTISPDGKFISYSQNYMDGSGSIYVRQTDTNTEVRLLEPGERIFGAKAFSYDGAYIYYIVYDKRDTDGALYRIPVLGGQPTRILGNINFFFTLSPDGTRAAFFRSDKERKQTNIIVAALDGSGAEQIVSTFNDEKESADSVPAFSPDGKRLAIALADEPNAVELPPARISVFTVEIDSGEIKPLTSEKWVGIGMMNWMPDASGLVLVGERERSRNQIYFLSYPRGEVRSVTNELSGYGNYGMGVTKDGKTIVADIIEYSSQLWTVGADGKTQNAVQLTTGDGDGGRGITSFPDGQIVYTSRNGIDYDLWTLRDSQNRREGNPLTSDAFFEAEPSAAPDGKFLVFASDRAGSQHLFRIDADGANLKQLTFGESIDSMPDISPDGNWIVYASYANYQNRIWKIPSGGGNPVQLTDYESVAPSISPDGKQIACIFPSDSRSKFARLDIVSFEDGAVIKSFEVLSFDYYYCAPRWTSDGKAVIFRRNDKPSGNIWKQNIAGGASVQVTDFKSEKIYNYAFAHDGKSILVSRGTVKGNVVLLKNFKPN